MKRMHGSLITLEPLDVDKHAPGYWALSQDESIHTYTGNTVPESVEEVRALLAQYEAHFLNWMIVEKASGAVIGILRLSRPQMQNGKRIAGESQRLGSAYWRKGHMKEAKSLFYPYVFDELGVDVLYADVWEGNVNSMRSLESYGYRLVETTEAVFSKTGRLTRQYLYALTKEEYQSRRKMV